MPGYKGRAGVFYDDLDIRFPFESAEVYALKIAYERFLRPIPGHSHTGGSYEIHFVVAGQGVITLDGEPHTVGPNSLYVTGPQVEHSQRTDEHNPLTEYGVYLKLEERAAGGPPHTTPLLARFRQMNGWIGQDTQNLHSLMLEMCGELRQKNEGYMLQVQALLQQLIVRMVRNYEPGRLSGDHFLLSTLDESSHLIIEECFIYEYADLTLEKLAARIGLSPRQTERLLCRHYGMTFTQKRTQARMSAAQLLLRDRARSVSDIASELGYSSAEYFASAFRQYYHTTASAFRRAALQE